MACDFDRLSASWDAYCLAKMRADAPFADRFDVEELRIATSELADDLASYLRDTELDREIVRRRMPGSPH